MGVLVGFLKKLFDLGFYTEVVEETSIDMASTATMMYSFAELASLEPERTKTPGDLILEVSCWLLMIAGIYTWKRIILGIGMKFDGAWMSFKYVVPAAILIMVFFSPLMRWFNNKKKPHRSLLGLLLAFVFGLLAAVTSTGLIYAGKFFVS